MPDPSRSSSTRCPLYAPDQIKVIFDKNLIFAQLINHQHLKLHNTQISFYCCFVSGKDLKRTYSPSGRSFCPAGYWISLPASLGHLNVGRGGGFFWQESLFDQKQPCCSHIEESVGGFSSVAEVVDNNLKVWVYQKSISYSN